MPERVLAAHELDDLDTANVGHVQVEKNELERCQGELLDGLETARCMGEGEPSFGT